jgi:hypothetical protein
VAIDGRDGNTSQIVRTGQKVWTTQKLWVTREIGSKSKSGQALRDVVHQFLAFRMARSLAKRRPV